jgi:alanine dehydrogenase
LEIANRGIERAAVQLEPVAHSINIMDGELTNRAVAKTFGLPANARFAV